MAKTKAQTNNQGWVSATVMDGYGSRRAKPRPYKQDLAVKACASWCYSAAMLNASAFASVPLRLYVRRKAGKKLFATREVPSRTKRYLAGDGAHLPSRKVMQKLVEFGNEYEEVTEPHPALQLLATVNPWMNGYELAVLRMLYLQITGNTYITYVAGPNGLPTELLLMPSQYTRVIPDKAKFIGGYEYGQQPNLVKYPAEDVIHWKMPNLKDVYYGMGRSEAVWNAIEVSAAKGDMDFSMFKNMARPDWMLMVEGAAPDTLIRLEADVQAKLQGVRNAGNFLAIGGKVQAIPLNFTPQELGDSTRVLEEIAAGFGVPISKLLANDPNRAGAETGDAGWLRDTILPYCRMDEEKLNAEYLPLFGVQDDAVLAYDDPVPQNQQIQADRLVKYVNARILTQNEARAEIGYDPVDGGDEFPEPVSPFGAFGGGGSNPAEDEDEPPKKRIKAQARPLPQGEHLAQILRRSFTEQQNAILGELIPRAIKADGGPPPDLPDKFIPLSKWDETIAEQARPVIELIMRQQSGRLLRRIGASPDVFSVVNRNIPVVASQLSLKFAESTNATTSLELESAKAKLRQEIADGIISGDVRTEMRKRVQTVFERAKNERAQMIASTESSRATHKAEQISAVESGVVSRKQWLLSSDACPICQAIADAHPQGIEMDKTFAEFGGEYGSIDGPPAHPNCQCSLTYEIDESALAPGEKL